MKKILLINHAGGMGGASKSLIDMVECIDHSRYTIALATVSCPDDSLRAFQEIEGIDEIIPIQARNLSIAHFSGGDGRFFSYGFLSSVWTVFASSSEMKKILKRCSPDIVIINSMTAFWIAILAKKMPCKTICWIRETFPKGRFGFRTKMIRKALIRYCDSLVFISDYDSKDFGAYKGLKKTIYDPVDVEKFDRAKLNREEIRQQLGLEQSKKYVLYLGGCIEFKGVDVVLSACELNNNADVKFILAGYGNVSGNREKRIEELIAQKKLCVLPPTPEVEKYYAIADVAIFPAIKAHQSRIIYEAWAARIPAVVSNFDNLKEFSTPTVFYSNVGDAVDLCEKIGLALTGCREDDLQQSYEMARRYHGLLQLQQGMNEIISECAGEEEE